MALKLGTFDASEARDKLRGTITLLYGEAGSGKTGFLTTALEEPAFTPMGLIAADPSATTSFLQYAPNLWHTLEHSKSTDFKKLFLLLESTEGFKDINSITIDSLDQFIKNAVVERSEMMDANKSRPEEAKVQMIDYAVVSRFVNQLITNVRGVNRHLFLTAHTTYDGQLYQDAPSGMGKELKVGFFAEARPNMPRAMWQDAKNNADNIWHFFRNGDDFYLATQPYKTPTGGVYYAKTRNALFAHAIIQEAKAQGSKITGCLHMGKIGETVEPKYKWSWFYEQYMKVALDTKS